MSETEKIQTILWQVPKQVISGPGSMKETAGLVQGTMKHPLVVTGPHLHKAGLIAPVLESLEQAGIRFTVFHETESDPSIQTVEKIRDLYNENACDGLIAAGGGSVLDAAKAAAVLISQGGRLQDYEGSRKVSPLKMTLLVIPATAGTGSEVTPFAVISDHERQVKMTVSSPFLIPDLVVLDPDLLANVPTGLAAATGMDALIHALESFVSRHGDFISDAFARRALEKIGGSLVRFVETGDKESAREMMEGSFLAGCAFSLSRLGLVHAMSHPLSAHYGIPHGVANALLLPEVIRFNEQAAARKYREAADLLGVPEDTSLADWVTDLNSRLEIKMKWKISEADLPVLIRDTMISGNVQANPREASADDVNSIYNVLISAYQA
ncbi:iron-containing alcohol dehydrogenase family protein [uncultured Faecalibaculum sp.]|uniref:iron-containing alcohol dehydrogenase family protein n=1 Tax=uncultured Faecalibaculum sp. TaxID=1729681 RepID=UPI0025E24F89|nr:iron-containing alcohol dehydrogenase [uncultured Faecalibaculum sp.]